jgi:hypothetical protein
MKEYRCYLLNRCGGIGDVIAFVSVDDSAALDQAHGHFERQNEYVSYEVWERTRLVFREQAQKQAAQG